MADLKVTDLSIFSGDLADGDLVHVVDVSDTTQDPDGSSFGLEVSKIYDYVLDKLEDFTVSDETTDGERGLVPQPLMTEQSYFLNAGEGWKPLSLVDLPNINSDTLLGRVSGGGGDIEEITISDFVQGLLAISGSSSFRSYIDAQENLSGLSIFTATVATDDKVLIQDTSGSNNLRTVTPQNILDLLTFTDTDDLDLTRSTNAISGVLKKEFISAKTDTVINASDEIIFGDATDSGNLKKDTVRGILDLVPAGVPAGSVTGYAGATLPSGWLWADGSVISRTTYADLFTAIGTQYGAGDGSTTFALPDLRGRVIAGKDNMDNSVGTGGGDAGRLTSGSKAGVDGDTLGANGGVEEHLLTVAESGLRNHQHPVSSSTASNTQGGGGATRVTSVGASTGTVNAIYGTGWNALEDHTNVQPTLVLNYIIKI